MKVRFNHEYATFNLAPEGEHPDNVDIGDETTVYIYYDIYDTAEVFTDELYFKDILEHHRNAYRQIFDHVPNYYNYDINVSQRLWFHGYEVEIIKHNFAWTSSIYQINWKRFDYEVQREKMAPLKDDLIAYLFHPDRVKQEATKRGIIPREYLNLLNLYVS
jgi:hypothetical protein